MQILIHNTDRPSELLTLHDELMDRQARLQRTTGRGQRKEIMRQIRQIERDVRRNQEQIKGIVRFREV